MSRPYFTLKMLKPRPVVTLIGVALSVLGTALFTVAVYAQTVLSNETVANVETVENVNTSAKTTFSQAHVAQAESFGPWPQPIPQDPGNELSGQQWAEQLGERLFSDPGLSQTGQLACISCHLPSKGFADGIPLAQGIAQHSRNTQGLFNLATQRWFGWDGGADSLWAASLRPLLSPIEMGAHIPTVAKNYRSKPYVVDALASSNSDINTALLDDEQFVVLLSKAIAAYTRTLISERTVFDEFRTALVDQDEKAIQNYPESAKRGFKIFMGEANCHVCHFGADFSNGEFHDTGRPFFVGVGEVDSGRYEGIKRVRDDTFNLLGDHNGVRDEQNMRKTRTATLGQVNFGQWKTPSLRNLSFTAPYMHDGSLATLRDVVDSYADIDPDRLHGQGESILQPLNLDDSARDDLVNFLKTLSEPAIQ